MNIDHFFKTETITIGLPIRHIDNKKINELSEEEFAAFYLALMTEYKTKDGWWSDKQSTPHCFECQKAIDSPQELRRYHGLSLHPTCFIEVYNRDKHVPEYQRAYFDRIAQLPHKRKEKEN